MLTRAIATTLSSLLVLVACIEETPRIAADTRDEVTPSCSEGDHECTSYDARRVCTGGQWRAESCAAGDICEREDAACHAGQYTCLGVLLCNFDCPSNDNACTTACNQGATVHAVDALLTLNNCQCELDCWPWLCGHLFPIRGNAAIATCVADHCPEEGAMCVGQGAVGEGACATVRECILDRCQGDAFCAEGCFGLGDAEAQTIAGFYYACLRDACGADPDSLCLANAQSGTCASQWQACTKDVAGRPSTPDPAGGD